MPDTMPPDPPHAARRQWMAVLARADRAAIEDRLDASGHIPGYQTLRGPEAGFVGHAYVTGRDERQAELAALADALLQDPARQPDLLATLIEPLAAAHQASREATAAKAAATRVQFFAMRNMRS